MHFKHLTWSVRKLGLLKATIDPKPQYQRGSVWGLSKQQLLIDSIINHFDVPKIYLRYVKGLGPFDYEVADGQQRLTAIWKFLADEFPLGEIEGEREHLSGLHFSEIPTKDKAEILKFVFIIAVVYQASNDEIRELFARLQKGERLTPPELRNSIASALGDVIRAMALTHPFFSNGSFSKERFKMDDLLAHAFALKLSNGESDIKAIDLARMYRDHKTSCDQEQVAMVNQILGHMASMQAAVPRCLKTKWGFVDVFWLLARHHGDLPEASALARRYVAFEQKRLKHTKNPEKLLAGKPSAADRRLYKYIMAFQAGGGTKEHLRIRHEAIRAELIEHHG